MFCIILEDFYCLKMRDKIKVGFCVAYDWYLLEYSLPLIYDHSDIICLSIDRNRISWSGLEYKFDDQNFFNLIKKIDRQGKINILEEDFSLNTLKPMANEVRQRNRMAEYMGSDGWHIQLDCDEYFVKFNEFINYISSLSDEKVKNANICCAWVILYKRTDNGFLFVDPEKKKNMFFIQIATKNPKYEYGRRNGNFNIYTPFYLIHQSWARSENEILEKIQNWGHSSDFDSKAYFVKWKAINDKNYNLERNLHPATPSLFPSLRYIEGKTIGNMIVNFNDLDLIALSAIDLYIKNSRLISKAKKTFSIFRNILNKYTAN